MSSRDKTKPLPLPGSLLRSLTLIDSQIAREMQRSPAERSEHGVQKWEPMNKRVEQIATHLLEFAGTDQCSVESLLVLTRACAKAAYILTDELGEEGLGKMRTQYCCDAAKHLIHDGEEMLYLLEAPEPLIL